MASTQLAATGSQAEFVGPVIAGLAVALGANLLVLGRIRHTRRAARSIL